MDTDNKTVVAQAGAVGQATRKDRRLYVGNLPQGTGLTERQVSEFISTSMRQRSLIGADGGDPVLSVWLSPEGTYAFVEFHTVDAANKARASLRMQLRGCWQGARVRPPPLERRVRVARRSI